MKRVVIVHCWAGHPDTRWYPSVKAALEKERIAVSIPNFGQEDPIMNDWVPKLQESIGAADEELVLVGHSVGCITILRYLETLQAGEKIKGAILIAGFTDDLSYIDPIEDQLKNFFTTPIDWQKIKTHCAKFVTIHSDDDPYVPLKHSEVLKEKLGAEAIIMHGMGHFSEPDGGGDTVVVKELPVVVEKVLEIFTSN